jgi:hypothetical protein
VHCGLDSCVEDLLLQLMLDWVAAGTNSGMTHGRAYLSYSVQFFVGPCTWLVCSLAAPLQQCSKPHGHKIFWLNRSRALPGTEVLLGCVGC